MKIFQGIYKGRDIAVPPGIRPVAARPRRSCFDVLAQVIQGARVLDLFAGSGALGFEALSRGAREAVFVDERAQCVEAIRRTISALALIDKASVYCLQALAALPMFFRHSEHFDLIFLDPPYYRGMLKKALQALEGYDIVPPSGYVVGFGYRKDEILRASETFEIAFERTWGQTVLIIYAKKASASLR